MILFQLSICIAIGNFDEFLHYASVYFDWPMMFPVLSDCHCNTHKVWFKFMNEQLPTDLVQLDVLFQKARGEGINIQVYIIYL